MKIIIFNIFAFLLFLNGNDKSLFRLGLNTGLNYFTHFNERLVIGASGTTALPTFDTQTGFSIFYGANFEINLSKENNFNNSIIIKLNFNSFSKDFSYIENNVPQLYGNDIESLEHINTAEITSLSTIILYKYEISETGFNLLGGFSIDTYLHTKEEFFININSPSDANFDPTLVENSETLVLINPRSMKFVDEQDIRNASDWRVGLNFGFEYQFNIHDKYFISPNFLYNYSSNYFVGSANWKIEFYQLGIDFRFNL